MKRKELIKKANVQIEEGLKSGLVKFYKLSVDNIEMFEKCMLKMDNGWFKKLGITIEDFVFGYEKNKSVCNISLDNGDNVTLKYDNKTGLLQIECNSKIEYLECYINYDLDRIFCK